jgi:hypothetical protein
MDDISPFEVMWTLWWGMLSSMGYGAISFLTLWGVKGKPEAQLFLLTYTVSFKTVVSLGLIFGTALIVFRYQNRFTEVIEAALQKVSYPKPSISLKNGSSRGPGIQWSSLGKWRSLASSSSRGHTFRCLD